VGKEPATNVKVPSNRITSRDGVNAARTFFEHQGCTFQEIGQQHDFGKDAYVDLADDGKITHLCVALQIKSGASYRTAGGTYVVPVENHTDLWRRSTVPVFGIVYDPGDTKIRWVDLTGYLRAHPEQSSGGVPVSGRHSLDALSMRGAFTNAVRAYAVRGVGDLTLNLLSPDPFQTGAVYDAWALSRSDAKYLLIVRRFLMDLQRKPLQRAIFLLSHAASHPNIFWTKDNWIPPTAEAQLLPAFRWSPEEVAHMLRAVDPADYGYGTLGECLDVLLYEDPNIVAKLHIAIKLLLDDTDIIQAVRAATLAISHSRQDQRGELELLTRDYSGLTEHEWFQDVSAAVRESADFSLYI
jgi:hypothetical protein